MREGDEEEGARVKDRGEEEEGPLRWKGLIPPPMPPNFVVDRWYCSWPRMWSLVTSVFWGGMGEEEGEG